MAHENDLALGFQAPDEVHTLRELGDVFIETFNAPAEIRGGEKYIEDGPFGGFEGFCECGDVGDG